MSTTRGILLGVGLIAALQGGCGSTDDEALCTKTGGGWAPYCGNCLTCEMPNVACPAYCSTNEAESNCHCPATEIWSSSKGCVPLDQCP
jgi:hypothetical protein